LASINIFRAEPRSSHDTLVLIEDSPPMAAPEIRDRPFWGDQRQRSAGHSFTELDFSFAGAS